MSYVFLGVVILGLAAVYWIRRSAPVQSAGIPCERTEDRGFYVDIKPEVLPRYQTALSQLFLIFDAPRLEGNRIPSSLHDAVEYCLTDASQNPQVSSKLLRVMLRQFLQADGAMRRQEDVLAHWAQQVVELDRTGDYSRSGIPSA